MCNKRNTTRIKIGKKTVRVDACISELITSLNENGIETVACCCGHGKYPVTILYRHKSNDAINGKIFDFCSQWGVSSRAKKRWYRRDKQGLFFIPEVQDKQNGGRQFLP